MSRDVEVALSVQQPWAWLIVNGFKDIENRTWWGRHRGRTLIHAGKKFDRDGYEWVRGERPHIPMPAPEVFERGGIVGEVTITGCVSRSDSPWFFGPYGFTLASPLPHRFRPARGMPGFFPVEIESCAAGDTGGAT